MTSSEFGPKMSNANEKPADSSGRSEGTGLTLSNKRRQYDELLTIARLSDFAAAVQTYKRAAALALEIQDEPGYVDALMELSNLCMRVKEFKDEMRTLKELAAYFEKQKKQNSFQITIERRIGLCFYHLRKTDEAVNHLRAAVARCQAAGDENIIQFVETLCTLSKVYRETFKYDRAKACIKQAYGIARHLEDKLWLQALVLEELARLMYDQHRIDRAVVAFTRVLKLKEQEYGVNHPQLIDTHTSLGLCFCDQSQFVEAETSFLKALELMRNVSELDMFYHTDALTRLASIYRKQGRFLEADLLEQGSSEIIGRAVQVRLGIFGVFDDAIEAFGKRDYDAALDNFRKALVLIESEFDKRAFMRVPILCRMAEIAEERQQRISASGLHVEIEDSVSQLSTGKNDVFGRIVQLARLFRVLKFDAFADSCFRYAEKMSLSRPDHRLIEAMGEHLELLKIMKPYNQSAAMEDWLNRAIPALSAGLPQITSSSTNEVIGEIVEVDIVDVYI